MLPEDVAGRKDHRDIHNKLHRRLNARIWADDHASIQGALTAAVSAGVRAVDLDPRRAYQISAPIDVPVGIELNGGGHYNSEGARLVASVPMDYMIGMADRTALVGCTLNANSRAGVGVKTTANFVRIADNIISNIADATGAAVRMGAALYPSIERNCCTNIAGFGLDALMSYQPDGHGAYYGINHGLSVQNIWGSRAGGMRVEGLLRSVCDDFETVVDGEAVVTAGGNVMTNIYLDTPYFELIKGQTQRMIGIKVNGSARVYMTGGQAFGDLTDTNSAFVVCNSAYGLSLRDATISRWATGITGAMANNMPVFVSNNYFGHVNTVSDLNTSSARVHMFSV